MAESYQSNPSASALRVLHVSPFFVPAWCYGGLVESAYQFSRYLARAGAAIRVLTTDANGPLKSLTRAEQMHSSGLARFDVRYCARAARQSVSLEMLRVLVEYVRWADVVHLHAAYSFPTLPTLLAAKLLDRPVVWTPHGALQRWRHSRRVALKSLWERACALTAPRRLTLHLTSSAEADETRARFPYATTALIPNGVEIPDSLSREPRGARLRLGFLGRLDPKKGIENLLAACRLLKDRGELDFALEIAGSGAHDYEKKIQAEITRLDLAVEVTMLGDIRDGAKRRMLERTDVIVVPSFTENFAIVVAEALAHGLPVIASTGTPWSELERYDCGLWVSNQPGTLAEAIIKINSMPLGEMGARGRRWMIERYSWSICAGELLALYQSILSQPGDSVLAPAHQS